MTEFASDHAAGDEEPSPGFSTFADLERLKPLAHPLRMRAYVEAVKEPVSAKELAERFDVPLQRMSYHVRALADAGLLRVVRRTPRRGAMETHYRAIATLEFDTEAFRTASPETQGFWVGAIVRRLAEETLHAVEHGAGSDPDFFTARAHFVVDDEGRRRLHEELRRFYERLAELEAELRVAPGERAHEINVLLGQYAGERAGGRNGPTLHGLTDDYETIPPD